MKKIMLIGDSIRLAYQPKVVERLKDFALVDGPDDNCKFSSYTLFHLSTWVPDDDFDVIQWNNGQWDTCRMLDGRIHTPLNHYIELQERIATILLKKTKRLIFATTTPVRPDHTGALEYPRQDEDIHAYNTAVMALLRSLDIEINDLNKLVMSDLERFISDDTVHLTDAGNDLVADRIVTTIQNGKA